MVRRTTRHCLRGLRTILDRLRGIVERGLDRFHRLHFIGGVIEGLCFVLKRDHDVVADLDDRLRQAAHDVPAQTMAVDQDLIGIVAHLIEASDESVQLRQGRGSLVLQADETVMRRSVLLLRIVNRPAWRRETPAREA